MGVCLCACRCFGYGVWGWGGGRGGLALRGRPKKAKEGLCYCRFCMARLFSFRLESETYLVVFWGAARGKGMYGNFV